MTDDTTSPLPADQPAHPHRARRALQIASAAVALALLGWVIALATNDANAQGARAIANASPLDIAAMFALTTAAIAINALMFWTVALPLRRLPFTDTLIINALATLLATIPFKFGLVVRTLCHQRLHNMRMNQIVPWLAAMGALALSVLVPLAAASIIRQQLDTLWWLISLGGIIACTALGLSLSRLARRSRFLRTISLGAYLLTQHPSIIAAHTALRLLDVTVLALRFAVAASIIGSPLSPDHAALIATTYFALSVLSPAGTLGPREMGVAALGFLESDTQVHQFALMALVVSAGELLTAAAISALGAKKIRPDRLLLVRSAPENVNERD